jgi:hypothetical protein
VVEKPQRDARTRLAAHVELAPGSASTASTTNAPAIGFDAAGCDSTTVRLSGVIMATTGSSVAFG